MEVEMGRDKLFKYGVNPKIKGFTQTTSTLRVGLPTRRVGHLNFSQIMSLLDELGPQLVESQRKL